jgi:phage tail-like protein
LRYLPTALWAQENDPQQFLGDMLRIFEKFLTGIPDGVAVGNSGRSYRPFEAVIDDLPQLFNPWRTPDAGREEDFLQWLASWLALNLRDDWSEYQRRKITSEIVSVYRLRGLEEGLHAYLDIYVQTEARPRIAIDDGKALLRVRWQADGSARLATFAYSQAISFPAVAAAPGVPARAALHAPLLIHVAALAADSNNDYLVVDQGVDPQSDLLALQRPALWKISSSGDVRYAITPAFPAPLPQPLLQNNFFRDAVAAVVDNQDRCSVINVGEQRAGLRRFAPPTYSSTVVIDQTTNPKLPVIRPVDMVLDEQQRFVILDRGGTLGGDPPTPAPAATKIVVVSEGPLVAEQHALPEIVEPTALVRALDGAYIVADARQFSSSEPANLWRVDPADNWAARPLLNDVPAGANPLVLITGMVFLTPASLLVCDTGLRWGFEGDQSNRSMAEPAALYRVDLRPTPPVITRVTNDNTLVNPSKMMVDRRGQIIIAERGEMLRRNQKRSWRARANEFGVIVHFSQQRPAGFADRNAIYRNIAAVVEEQKPAHTSWWLKSE